MKKYFPVPLKEMMDYNPRRSAYFLTYDDETRELLGFDKISYKTLGEKGGERVAVLLNLTGELDVEAKIVGHVPIERTTKFLDESELMKLFAYADNIIEEGMYENESNTRVKVKLLGVGSLPICAVSNTKYAQASFWNAAETITLSSYERIVKSYLPCI